MYDKLTKKGIMHACWVLLGVAVACVGFLWTLPELGVASGGNIVTAMVAIGVLGMVVSPAYYLP